MKPHGGNGGRDTRALKSLHPVGAVNVCPNLCWDMLLHSPIILRMFQSMQGSLLKILHLADTTMFGYIIVSSQLFQDRFHFKRNSTPTLESYGSKHICCLCFRNEVSSPSVASHGILREGAEKLAVWFPKITLVARCSDSGGLTHDTTAAALWMLDGCRLLIRRHGKQHIVPCRCAEHEILSLIAPASMCKVKTHVWRWHFHWALLLLFDWWSPVGRQRARRVLS